MSKTPSASKKRTNIVITKNNNMTNLKNAVIYFLFFVIVQKILKYFKNR